MVTKRAGTGRDPGRYMRSSNLLKQLEAEFEHPKPDSVRATDLLKQDNLYGVDPLKVITEEKSDHLSDHFCSNSPTQVKVFEQTGNPDSVSDVCSNSPTPLFEQVLAKKPVTAAKFRYSGKNLFMNRLCKGKHLEIIAENGEFATVNHPDWLVTQTIPVAELKPVK
jgi:hypothetical protein